MNKKWWQRPLPEVLAETKLYRLVRVVLSRIVLPGFHGMPLWEVIVFFVRGLQHGAVGVRAAALSYNFFLAIFPGIIFFFTLIPYLPIKNLSGEVLQLMKDVMPDDLYKVSAGTITDIVNRKRSGLLSLVFFTSLYFSTSGISSIIQAFNRTYHTFETRTWWQQRGISIALTLIGFVSIIVVSALFIFGDSAVLYLAKKYTADKQFFTVAFSILKYLVILAMTFLGISSLYYYGPAKKIHYRFFSAGSIVATVLFLASSYGFSVYLNYFNSYNKLYGSIGTIILLLVWINLNAWVLLLGFELNASIRSARDTKNTPLT